MQKQTIASGKWQPTVAGTPHQWTGQCGKCSARVEAIKLTLKTLPFGRGEVWACPNCR